MFWLSHPILGLNALPYGLICFLAPSLILYLLLFVTGIPPTEKQAIFSKGELYKQYQKEVKSSFFPLG